jgi:hypothetical protein
MDLEFRTPARSAEAERALAFYNAWKIRAVDAPVRLSVEKINGETVKKSPYKATLEKIGFVPGYSRWELY